MEPAQKASLEDIARWRDEGKSAADMVALSGLNQRTVMRKIATLKRRLIIPPLAAAVPDGFEVTKLSTRLDSAGNPVGQSIRAEPIPEDAAIEELIPPGHVLKGISSYVVDGEVRGQWVKTKRDEELAALARQAALNEMIGKIVPMEPIAVGSGTPNSGLLSMYTITDAHVGMLAWAKETQAEPWDLSIAEQVLLDSIARLIESAPNSYAAILNQLGDFLHFDSLLAVTPTSGHNLDADSRYQKVVQAAVRILIQVIAMLLRKHQRIFVYMHEGNHDMAGSVWLRVMFATLFKENPRVGVELSPNPYQAFKHGKTMLAFHHGHLAKKVSLPQIFAAQYSPMWGETEYRYIHVGHLHNEEQKEYPGIKLLQHPTLASPDAYAARFGWLSKRQAMRIDYSDTDGEIGRAVVVPR